MNRIITVPESVPLVIGAEPWTFTRALESIVDRAGEFNQTGSGIRASIRVLAAFKDAKVSDTVTLSEPDWALLKSAFNATPILPGPLSAGNPPQPVHVPGLTFLGYLDAVDNAEAK